MSEERRFGTIIIVIETKESIARLNTILSYFSELIIGRQGIVLRERDLNIISLVLEGNPDEIGAFSGQLGRLRGIKVKTTLIK
jgi:putative iron-only hydrogenase system regulator